MSAEFDLPHQIGRYVLTRRLGRGGMGVVFAARDDRLGREVAVKLIAGLSSEDAVKRFWREARTAASVNHPHVCQIFEVDESADGIFLAMELLEGQSLEARLAQGPLSPADAVTTALEMLDALDALHVRGIVHRDIKPSNVFITEHGVKLLDFGLARPIADDTIQIDSPVPPDMLITKPGLVVGTPRYMAPEQLTGQTLDGRTDLYAVGTVLFEMLAGRPPFASENVFNLAHAILNEHPPALQGPSAVAAIDRVIRRALSKRPAERHPDAAAMSAELQDIPLSDTRLGKVTSVRTLLRVIIPPIRLVRQDPDTAFLSFGLAESVSASLAGLKDIVVRAPSLAAKWVSSEDDPRRLASEADVDVIVIGSLNRMGDQLRATVQLLDANSGTVAGGITVRGVMSDIFALEDELARKVAELLTPLRSGASGPEARRDVPANARAFELFLRGLELARTLSRLREARECFDAALREDPAFAPAWAWIGRCHRVIGKYEEDYEENDRRAEEAFRRALALSPELPVAHRFFTHFESEHGKADAAIGRLLQYAKANRNDAQLFAALVHALRYAGLNGASLAAHEEARRLDPTVPTSVEYTLLLAGDLERLRALQSSTADITGAHAYLLVFSGHVDALADIKNKMNLSDLPASYRSRVEALTGALSGGHPMARMQSMMQTLTAGARNDPEAVFLSGMMAAHFGEPAAAIESIDRAVRSGFTPVLPLERSHVLDNVRGASEFAHILDVARQRRQIALAIFERGGGPALLGVSLDKA